MNKTDNFDKLVNVLSKFLRSATLIPCDDFGLFSDTVSQHIIGPSTHYTDEETDKVYKLCVEKKEWISLLTLTETMFDDQLSAKNVNQTINIAVYDLKFYPFDEEQIQATVQNIARWLISQAEAEMFAYLPVFGLSVQGTFQVDLGSAVLFSGGDNSEMAKLIQMDEIRFHKDKINITQPFLRIPVSGDSEHRKKQVEDSTRDALAIFRFARGWKSVSIMSGDVSYALDMPNSLYNNLRAVFIGLPDNQSLHLLVQQQQRNSPTTMLNMCSKLIFSGLMT